MILLIIDDDPTWSRFLSANFPTTTDPGDPWQLAVVSALQMRDPERVPAAIWQRGAIVATNSPASLEGAEAFRLGALRYFAKES